MAIATSFGSRELRWNCRCPIRVRVSKVKKGRLIELGKKLHIFVVLSATELRFEEIEAATRSLQNCGG